MLSFRMETTSNDRLDLLNSIESIQAAFKYNKNISKKKIVQRGVYRI